MVLNNVIIIFFMLALTNAHAETILPEFITKQDISNLRFISRNGKFTYYQRRSGALLVSTNYSVKKVLQGKVNSHYLVSSTPARKALLIIQDESFHSFLSLNKLTKIYTADFDGQNIFLLGEGVNPRLHLDDSKISFYDPYKKIITVKGSRTSSNEFSVKIMAGPQSLFSSSSHHARRQHYSLHGY